MVGSVGSLVGRAEARFGAMVAEKPAGRARIVCVVEKAIPCWIEMDVGGVAS